MLPEGIPAELTAHTSPPSHQELVCISPERYAYVEQAERLLAAAEAITHETIWTVISAGAFVPSEDLGKINDASKALSELVEAREALSTGLASSAPSA